MAQLRCFTNFSPSQTINLTDQLSMCVAEHNKYAEDVQRISMENKIPVAKNLFSFKFGGFEVNVNAPAHGLAHDQERTRRVVTNRLSTKLRSINGEDYYNHLHDTYTMYVSLIDYKGIIKAGWKFFGGGGGGEISINLCQQISL